MLLDLIVPAVEEHDVRVVWINLPCSPAKLLLEQVGLPFPDVLPELRPLVAIELGNGFLLCFRSFVGLDLILQGFDQRWRGGISLNCPGFSPSGSFFFISSTIKRIIRSLN